MQTTAGASLTRDDTKGVKTRRRTATLLVIAAVILTLDQLTKVWAVEALQDGRVINVVGDVLQFRLVRNPGAAFSMFTNLTVVLTVIAVAVVLVIGWLSRKVTSLVWAVALGGLLGGALGTLTDRIFREPGPMRGHVVDFIELPNWPVFNIADSSIVGAAALIALLSFRGVAFSTLGAGPATDEPVPGESAAEDATDGDTTDADTPDERTPAGADTGLAQPPPGTDVSESPTEPTRPGHIGAASDEHEAGER
ncbi:signal peptidase II [Phytoactinopolyspora mesophila]|uniref:Lipoprotein signal peptidase n=1 Tax=Phytoactinopolyspora mesophila TaxID=2650750 RepID=A0A7K3M785_9ACTN|nr:signal peptidase II [Phytoactinopolyspora mesophila]NDL59181.1 signal peptidase II [Phytoactinopolyspora mesophila]